MKMNIAKMWPWRNRHIVNAIADGLPTSLSLTGEAQIEFHAAADDKPAKRPTFEMLAYTGGMLRVAGFYRPVVIDLSGLKASARVSILKDHDPTQLVGQSTEVVIDKSQVTVAGQITGSDDDGPTRQVLSHARNGFAWPVSVGVLIGKLESVADKTTVTVNGQQFTGPIYIVRSGLLREVSFVGVGADDKTSSKIAAEAAHAGETDMEFEQWLEAMGLVSAELSDDQRSKLQAKYDAEQAATEKQAQQNSAPAKVEAKADGTDTQADGPDIQAQLAELQRRDGIRSICAGTHEPTAAGEIAKIEAKAITENWSVDKVAAEVDLADRRAKLEASYPAGPAIHANSPVGGPLVLEAAAMMAGGINGDDLTAAYGDQTVEAADKRFPHGIGLQQILLEAAWANGCVVRHFRDDSQRVLEAAFSTFSLPGILSNVANKFLLAGFESVETAWRQIAAIRSVKDFKASTSYRMTGGFEYEEVGPTGELKHATVGEESFTNQAKTYGRMFSITRTDLINDDMGALTALPRRIGRGGGLKLNSVFWTEFMDDAAFFTSGHGNYITGSTTALGIDSLTAVEVLFRDQSDADGNPLALLPKKLVVPTALNVGATQLMSSLKLNETTTANKAKPVDNPHAGKFDVVSSTYLNSSSISGASAKAWRLLADPADLAVIEVAFLNGQQTPKVERADADFNTLGIQFRGYFDFGVAKQDYRAGVKAKGEA